MRDGRDLADGNKPLFVHRFSNDNGFASALHDGGVVGVTQDNDEKYDGNYDDNSNTDEDPDDPPGLALDPTSDRGEISGVPPPENPVELPGVEPP